VCVCVWDHCHDAEFTHSAAALFKCVKRIFSDIPKIPSKMAGSLFNLEGECLVDNLSDVHKNESA